jgi:cell division protease FtsH
MGEVQMRALRGIGALGYTIQRPLEDRFLMDRMTVLLGSRASESPTFEEGSMGAADDLAKAMALVRDMVVRFVVDAKLGHSFTSCCAEKRFERKDCR